MPRIALLTDRSSRPLDDDLAPLGEALVAQGAEAAAVAWDEPDEVTDERLARFDLVVVRSTWAYPDHAERYVAAIDRIATVVDVCNPPAVLRWNVDKAYLADLAAAGLPVTPTGYLPPRPGAAPGWEGEAFDAAVAEVGAGAGELVVKPSVSAGSRHTGRFRTAQREEALALVRALHARGRTAMVQPYLGAVDTHGETAIMAFDGVVSHCLRKGPLLALDAPLVAGAFAPEHLSARTATEAELALAERALSFVAERFGAAPLYARVDLLTADDGTPTVLEVELNEPSMFHAHAPGSADRFATAILRRAAGG